MPEEWCAIWNIDVFSSIFQILNTMNDMFDMFDLRNVNFDFIKNYEALTVYSLQSTFDKYCDQFLTIV
jgi:hypothetical protein